MGVFRLYTGEDGTSRMEDQSLASHPALTTPQPAAHIVFQSVDARLRMPSGAQ